MASSVCEVAALLLQEALQMPDKQLRMLEQREVPPIWHNYCPAVRQIVAKSSETRRQR
jgi:hypothetical protein